MERLAKALGLEVVVEERLQPAVKGYIQGNAIHLPPSSPDAAMEILRHELTHRMQELSPRQYGKYRDYVIRQYTAADAAAKYEAYRRAGHPLTPEQVVDELVADYAGRHLREERAIRRLTGENRTLAEWVRRTIRALAQSIREKLGRAEPTLEHAQRLWERAFRAAEQHASRQNPSVPLPSPEPPARYSIREEIDSSHSGEYTVENAGMGDSETVTTNKGNEVDITPAKNHTTTTKNPGSKGPKRSSIDILDENGNIKTRRWFDEQGHAYRDVDMTNHGNPSTHPEWPHEHTWDWSSGNGVRK